MAPSTSTPSNRSRPLTRSQTGITVLGKRASLSRSSSVVSNRSTGLMTPESTPKKRVRKSLDHDDGMANKENIPPEFLPLPPSPAPSRLSRRSSFSSDISSISMLSRSSIAIRRAATYNVVPQTPSSILNSASPATPSAPVPSLDIPLYLRVRGLLRATSNANNAMSMEGREAERDIIEAFLHSLDGAVGSGAAESVLYVSGSPGTGKTALVNSIIASTKVADDVKVVFINCMALAGMDALWEKLADELKIGAAATSAKGKAGRQGSSGKKVNGKDKVSEAFEKQSDIKCILVLDELDNLTTTSNELQTLFSLAASCSSKLRIMGIANTHTLTSTSVLPASEMEKLDVQTIHFSPYGSTELLAILNKRFEELPQDELKKLLPAAALTLLTKKVSALTGDVRVLFEVLRGAVDAAVFASSASSSDALKGEGASKISVTPAHILAALKTHAPSSNSKAQSGAPISNSSGNSEIIAKVCGLGLQQRLVLLAIVLASKRTKASLPVMASTSVASITPPSTPTKRPRSPVKRTSSSSAVSSGTSSDSITNAASFSTIDSSQLYSYYSALLAASDTFTAVSRSEFADLLGILETTGLVLLTTTLASPRGGALKRMPSFAGSMKSNAAGGVQRVSLQERVREAEVVRGLGIVDSSESQSTEAKESEDGDALGDGVRTIYSREMVRIRREAKAKDTLDALHSVDVLEDAIVL